MACIGVNLRVTGHCSQGGRKYMEDMFAVAYQQTIDLKHLEYAFCGIFDGHGGPEAAIYAKEHLLKTIISQKHFWSDNDDDILRAIHDGFLITHYAMWRDIDKWPQTSRGLPSTSGTTATVAFIMKGKIYIGHVGDTCIVLGSQEKGQRDWTAHPLTEDHKPEAEAEKLRIYRDGGKVMSKAGVPRVVWNRPHIGHRGPVRRSTSMNEIPFLAVARSLGDFWSYNSQYDRFVVSPEPDVSVCTIDTKRHKCLIFGTDGLWNAVTPDTAVCIVQAAEEHNETCSNQNLNWYNPSKCLVDRAMRSCRRCNVRADNTSVVVLLLDPPGPPNSTMIGSNETSVNYCTESCKNSRQSNGSPVLYTEVPHSGGLAIYTHYPSSNVSVNSVSPSSSDDTDDDESSELTDDNEQKKEDVSNNNTDEFKDCVDQYYASSIGYSTTDCNDDNSDVLLTRLTRILPVEWHTNASGSVIRETGPHDVEYDSTYEESKRRKLSSTEWEAPTVISGKPQRLKVKMTYKTKRTLRSDTNAATRLKTLRSCNVDLPSQCGKRDDAKISSKHEDLNSKSKLGRRIETKSVKGNENSLKYNFKKVCMQWKSQSRQCKSPRRTKLIKD